MQPFLIPQPVVMQQIHCANRHEKTSRRSPEASLPLFDRKCLRERRFDFGQVVATCGFCGGFGLGAVIRTVIAPAITRNRLR